MDSEEIIKTIALTQVPLVGNVATKNLISYCGSASAVFKTPKAKLLKIPDIGEKIADSIAHFKDFKTAEEEFKYIEKYQVKVYHYTDAQYPIRLKHIVDAPVFLFGHGDTEMNVPRVISIVGTRNATSYGREWCEQFVSDLSETGCIVVSGLASGIDTIAHKSSLKAHLKTIAVMGSGLQTIYPAQNKNLARQIVDEGGSILTEYLSDVMPQQPNFPERNRIVAGMSDAVIVVETKKKGGSMIS
ncbi:MAG: DNA-protecting protein DprA [Bacteroidetes bacterium]|nr:DNA-protecting protein DprA [Bacteroidota bacterium]